MKKRSIKKSCCLSVIVFLIGFSAQFKLNAQTGCTNLQFLNDFVPVSTDPTLTVNVSFWVFGTTSSFTDYWGSSNTSGMDYCLSTMNTILGSLDPPFNAVSGVTHIPDSKIRLIKKNFHKIVDATAYDNIGTSYPQDHNYFDADAINVYFGSHASGPSTASADTPETPGQIIRFYGDNMNANVAYVDEALLHELGHALGNAPENEDTEGYASIAPNFGCCSIFYANDYYQQNSADFWSLTYGCSPPVNPAGYTNNIMSYNWQCRKNLSPQQLAIMHYSLRTKVKKVLIPASYTAATSSNASFDYDVTTNQSITVDRYFKGNITVKANKTLTVSCGLAMTHGAKIIVEPGAMLIVDGGTITNVGELLWGGVYLMGDFTKAQMVSNPSNPGSSLYQGMLRMKNGGTISQASIGVTNYGGQEGGIILAQDANFINNVTDVFMDDPHTAGSLPIANGSWFYNCNFKTTGTIANGVAPQTHANLKRVSGIKFMACVFQCTESSLLYVGNGISSVDANYIVDQYYSVPTVFQGLYQGIYVNNTNPLKIPAINNTQFISNFYGAYFMNANYLAFQTNTLQGSSSEGVYLNNCKYYKIKNNVFSGATGYAPNGVGVAAYRSKTGTHEIYRNTFSNLDRGINCMDDNGNPNNPYDGLKMNCNIFTVTPNNYDVVLSYTSGLALPLVNINQGDITGNANQFNLVRNVYGANCGNQNKWQIYSGSTVTINHGSNTNTLTAVTQPTATGCKSGYLYVVDKNISLNYSTDCSLAPPSSGGTSTTSSIRLGVMNDYIGDLKTDEINTGENHHFEIQSTVSSKINLFLTDTLEGSIDSVITILENNPGNMEDADIQTVFAYMSKGDYTAAQDKVNALTGRTDWVTLLNKLIALEQDTLGRIDSLHTDDIDFLTDYANTDKDGQAAAQALLFSGAGVSYTEPHALPEESTGARLMNTQITEDSKLNDVESRISIYPNPAQTGITIYYSSREDGKVKIELSDLVGRVIYTNFINERSATQYIQMNQLSSGMYLITLSKGKEVIHKEKLIKE